MTVPAGVDRGGDPEGRTSFHVRRARRGDAQSLAWVVERFSPLLLAQARYRLGPQLRTQIEPEDLVAETWAVALPRLASLDLEDRRETPALLRFLATTLVHKVSNLVRRRLRRGAEARGAAPGPDEDQHSLDDLAAETAGIVTRALRAEREDAVARALAALDVQDREVVILRGVEGLSNPEAAILLGEKPNTVSHRYHAALGRLRAALPGSLFDDFEGGTG